MKQIKIHSEPGYQTRRWDSCDWVDENGQHVMHERIYHGGFELPLPDLKVLKNFEPTISYWTEILYTDLELANKEAKIYGFTVVEEFYADPGTAWFASFDNFDKALAAINAKLKEQNFGFEYISE